MSEDKNHVPARIYVLLGFIALIAALLATTIYVGTKDYTNWGMTILSWIELFGLIALVVLIVASIRRDWAKIVEAASDRDD